MKKIIFICTGNTCRSPMAEISFKNYLIDHNVTDIEASSAGISAATGDSAAENAILAMNEVGEDLTCHRARQLSAYDFNSDSYYVCMTQSHKVFIQQYVNKDRIYVLDIPDPFGGSLGVYSECLQKIKSSFNDIFRWLDSHVEIRRMEEQDVKAVALIEKKCFSVSWSEKSIRDELSKENSRFFVALKQGKTVGYIGANNILGEVYITNLAVLEGFRRQGIAKELICKLITVCAEESAEFVTLEVRESNKNAISLYTKMGFVNAGERKSFYSKPAENAIIMTRVYKNAVQY